jgi:ferrous iron transport protein A
VKKEIPLLHLNTSSGIVTRIEGGYGMKIHLGCLGIRVNKRISKVSSQPFRGPVVIEVDGKQVAMGRGMCRKIFVAVEE